ncbi:MAG: hypothetical protein Q8L39_04700 [Burkholderiales bacterium]|nr:hypothetical protein [Burkholderiales bacterium]
MPISKEQWVEIEYQLSSIPGRVELRCDGHAVVAEIAGVGTLKQGIAVYIDGSIKGIWLKGEDEIARKFHRESKRFARSMKTRELYKKTAANRRLPKDVREEYARRAAQTYSIWYPWWTNVKAFRRHISKTCKEIDIVKIGYGG